MISQSFLLPASVLESAPQFTHQRGKKKKAPTSTTVTWLYVCGRFFYYKINKKTILHYLLAQAAAARANMTAKMVMDRVSHKTKIDVFENAFRKIKEVCWYMSGHISKRRRSFEFPHTSN